MRIAILASNYIRLPPEREYVPEGASGAPEKIMYQITEELVKRGHDVTLFASGDSCTSAKLVSVTELSTTMDKKIGIGPHIDFEHILISKCYQMARKNQFDMIHSIFDTKSAFYAPLVSIPTVSTLHSPLDGFRKRVLQFFKNTQYYISISNSQRKPLPDLHYAATIYHGLAMNEYIFQSTCDDYILFSGRIAPEKGSHIVIKIAKDLNKNAYLLGTHSLNNTSYWDSQINPNIDNKLIHHEAFIPTDRLHSYYQSARLFLFPIQWEEPFGLVMIESMACGTPVIAFARGSVPEVIKDGETGFIVNSSEDDIRGNFIVKKTGIEGLKEAVERIYAMPEEEYRQMRLNSRKHVEDNFTVEKMVNRYEKVYEIIMKEKGHLL